jgi:hypothetical protein
MPVTTTLRNRFVEAFDAERHDGFSTPDSLDKDPLVSADNVVMYVESKPPWIGGMRFEEYEENDGWSMGYWDDDGTTKSVYTFNRTSDERHTVSIQAPHLDTVASLLGETPAEVADRVRTANVYPVEVPMERGGLILISPIIGNGNHIEHDD